MEALIALIPTGKTMISQKKVKIRGESRLLHWKVRKQDKLAKAVWSSSKTRWNSKKWRSLTFIIFFSRMDMSARIKKKMSEEKSYRP